MSHRLDQSILAARKAVLARRFDGRVFISGTGRAGTTFLVQLLTELGLDTGFPKRADARTEPDPSDPIPFSEAYYPSSRAGLEHDLFSPENPFIVKSPYLCDHVDAVLAAGIAIAHIIVPVRDVRDAAESRRFVQAQSTQGPGHVPGGLWDVSSPETQEAALALKFIRLVEAGARHEIPMTFLSFPRLVRDPDYTFERLRFLLPLMSARSFRRVFAECADPKLVDTFKT
jgi:hypothetical protein